MTNARQMPPGWNTKLGIDWALCVHVCLCQGEHELHWTHNFFILDKGCPILTRWWCFLHRRQTVCYHQESGSPLAVTSRCSSILAIGGFYHTVENTSVDVLYVGSREGLPSALHWEVSWPTLDHHLSRGGSGQLSPRSPSLTDQRVKVQFEKLNVECGNFWLLKKPNAKCWMRKSECTFHSTWRSN